MLRSYLPIYEIARKLEAMRVMAEAFKGGVGGEPNTREFSSLLAAIERDCPDFGLVHTSEMAKRALGRPMPENYGELYSELTHLNDALSSELEKEAVYRIPPERRGCFEQENLFGSGVATAFPSCARDIQKAGSCYALEQEDACVHHLMLVLESGLKALAAKVGVPYQLANWQRIIDGITKQLNSLPRGPNLDFYRGVNAQFGFLKDAYRNHSEHAHKDPYDMPKALSILNHVREFMQQLAKGGLSEEANSVQ